MTERLRGFAVEQAERIGTAIGRALVFGAIEPDRLASLGEMAREAIQAARPTDGFLDPVSPRLGSSGLAWEVAVDGHDNLVHGLPQTAVLVAVQDEHGPLLTVLRDPVRHETFLALRRRGSSRDGHGIEVSPSGRGPTVAAVDGPRPWTGDRDPRWICFGTPLLDLAWVACGRLDGAVVRSPSPRGWRSASLLVSEAGGTVDEGTDVAWAGAAGFRPAVVALSR